MEEAMPVHPRTVRLLVVGVGLALAASLVPSPAAAVPDGWTSPERIPGTSGQFNHESAMAPDGTDADVWIVQTAPGELELRGRVRLPGTTSWQKVDPYVTDAIQDVKIAGDRSGDFWLTWVRYNPTTGIPQVLVARLLSGPAKMTEPQTVFDGADYGHQAPLVAVSDRGTVFVAATARPKEPSSPPRYRAEVAVKELGKPWRTRFLSPVDVFAVARALAVSPNGHAVVAFRQGYDTAEARVRAATRAAGSSAWTVNNLSVAGDGQSMKAAIGPDGTAAVTWNAPASGSEIVRLSYRDVTTDDPWTGADLVTGPGLHQVEQPVVDEDGYITAFWWDGGQIWARQVQDGVLLSTNAVSPGTSRSDVRDVVMGSQGLVGLLYQSYNGAVENQGLRFRWVDHGLAYEEQVLTTLVNGDANNVQLALDAADRANVVWAAGEFPVTELQSMGNPPVAPTVMTTPHFGEQVIAASLTGRERVGSKLTCSAGYVVEAKESWWRWYRDGDVIRGEVNRSYALRSADAGARVKCAFVAFGLGETTVLDSPAVRVRR
jgi:hypothetical protein